MINQLRILKKENKTNFNNLCKVNQEIIENWIEYAKFSNINPYDFQLCYRDLIHIARQAELNHKKFSDYFGENPRNTAEAILKKYPKKKLIDYLLFDFKELLAILCINWFLIFTLTRQLTYPISVGSICASIFIFILPFFYRKIIEIFNGRQLFTYKNLKPNYLVKYLLGIPAIIPMLILFVTLKFDFSSMKNILFKVPNIMIPIICCGVYIILYVLQINYTNKLAEKRPWKN